MKTARNDILIFADRPKDTKHNPPPSSESDIVRWRCPNCGQTHFTTAGDTPPDICAYCRDMTTWQRVTPED